MKDLYQAPFIRQATLSDLPYLYEICLKTGHNGNDASDLFSDSFLIGQFFSAPYLHFNTEYCFVVENKGRPAGYIIAAPDSDLFDLWLNETWLPPLRQNYPRGAQTISELESFLYQVIHTDAKTERFLTENYPAHLHIDLLPELQGMGFGRKLIETLINKLKSAQCIGLHLGASDKNTNAISFYKKIGFHVIKEQPGVVYMGQRFLL